MPDTTTEIEPTELAPQPETVPTAELPTSADALAVPELPSPETFPVPAKRDEAAPEVAPQEAPEPVDTAPAHIESGPFAIGGTNYAEPARFRSDDNDGVALVQVLGTGITQVTYIDGPAVSAESPKP